MTTMFVSETPVSPQVAWERFARGPAPDWVEHVQAPDHAEGEGALTWLLFEEQQRFIDDHELFCRYVRRADNEVGVDWLSEIRIVFNPSFQTLTLHDVTSVRDGVRSDALLDADIDFMRIEHEMHARIYRGDYVLVIQVRGLEPLDTLDYSYTITGQNPVFGGRAVSSAHLTYGVPIGRHFCRVLRPDDGSVQIHPEGPVIQPVENRRDGVVEWRLDRLNVARHEFEQWVPAEFDDQASVWSVSGFRTWADVARWSAELYATSGEDPAIASLAEGFRAQNALRPELAAIAYVQNRIRYVATNFGEGGYRPRDPCVILQRRYGDCKDKSLLLVGLLRALGVKAEVALVSTRRPRGPLADTPSPGVFDHVIVRAVIDDELCWIDATTTGQVGPLALRGRPHDMAALVAHPMTTGCEIIPPLSGPHGDHSDGLIDMSLGVGEPVMLEYVSRSMGKDAEMLRQWIASMGISGVEREFLNLNSEQHGPAEQASPIEIADEEATNTITIRNSIRLLDPWGVTPEGGREFRNTLCYATTLLPAISTNRRKRPLSLLNHPLHHLHAETVRLPKDQRPYGLKTGTIIRHNDAFEFTRKDTLAGDEFRVVVETRTISPYLSAKAVIRAQRDEAALKQGHELHLVFPPRV